MASATSALREREHELGALREGLERACAGTGSLLLVEGPAGVGKTELVREACAAAARARMTPLEARGSELEQPFAFGIVRQLLEAAIDGAPERAELFAGAAGPAERLFEPDEWQAPGAEVGFEALHSLYWLMVNLADRGPLLVSVDDCQWVDHGSLRFLAYLAQRIEGLRVAMLLAGRPPDSATADEGSLWAQVASRPETGVLHPEPLSESASVAWAQERLGAEAAEEFCRACHRATGGNPLFLRELLSALDAAGVEPSDCAASEVQAVGPAAVSRFVLHRLATLGSPAGELARAVAVLGDDSELRLAGRVSGLSEDAVRASADDLVRADILAGVERLRFVHPIVRAALYEDLAPRERQARHAAAAQALAKEGASPERVTAHLLLTAATGDQGRIDTLRSAARVAARNGDPGAAVARLRRALAESPGGGDRAEILTELGRLEVTSMQFRAAAEHLELALTSAGDPTVKADAASALGRGAIASGGRSAETAVDALASLAAQLRPLDPERSLELRCELLTVATAVPRMRADVAGHLQRLRDEAAGHPGFEAVARIHTAQEQVLQGRSATAAAEEVEAALMEGLPAGAASNATFVALLTLELGERYELASRLLDVGLEDARREGHATRQGMIHGRRAAIALERGSLHDAEVEAETGLLLVENQHFVLPQLLAVAIVAHIERGDLAAADGLAQRGEALAIGEDRLYLDQYLVARGRLRIAQGQVREGVADLMWCGERLEAYDLLWPSDWKVIAAPALASLGDSQTATRLAREQLAVARGGGAPGALGRSLRAAGLAIGGDEGVALLEEAVTVLEGSAARLELAHALADLGTALGRSGKRREGRDSQRRAIELAAECGATALAERARAELHAGPGRRPRTELTGPGALTAAEWRVCRQVADGHTNREVAQALFVTEKTVERHLSSAYHKLGIRSRYQLPAAIAPTTKP